MFDEIRRAFGIADPPAEYRWTVEGQGALPSWFAVSDLAEASIAAAGIELAAFACTAGLDLGAMTVDRRLASLWFDKSLRPDGWTTPPQWDSIAGDYPTEDGWIRLHTNAPHHRAACLSVLGCDGDRDAVARTVRGWAAAALEDAAVAAGGCAAEMRSLDDWGAHPQGAAVAMEPLVIWEELGATEDSAPAPKASAARPLAGIRVLDLTRILAGPAATRFLAAFGAEVLRIDPPFWDDPNAPEMALGKRCAGLDLRCDKDRKIFAALLSRADVLVHGYRPGALDGLGLGEAARREINPGLTEVGLCAYGWSGPWAKRRGFDSLVQMSAGIADHGMKRSGADRPVPLPVQALDHGAGYLMAAAALHALRHRRQSGCTLRAKLSLARTARLLCAHKREAGGELSIEETPADLNPTIEQTAWGPARRLRFPLSFNACHPGWARPARPLRSAPPEWASRG